MQLHIWMGPDYQKGMYMTMAEVYDAMRRRVPRIDTDIPLFCSPETIESGYRILVHMTDGKVVEVKEGVVNGHRIRDTHDWVEMLLNNDFGKAIDYAS